MSLSTKSFKQVLYGAYARMELVIADLSPEQNAAGAEFVTSAMKLAWEFYPWPDALEIRSEAVISHPTVAGARYVPRSNAQRTLKVVLNVWDADPRASRSARQVFHTVQSDGLYFYASSPATVWIQYRPEPPEYTSRAWSNAATYGLNDLVWDAAENGTGHVYRALGNVAAATPLNNAASWAVVPVLACLAEPLKTGLVATWRAAGGQYGTARLKLDYMQEQLEHEILQIQHQGGMTTFY